MERNDERYVESEIHRINAELKLKQAARNSSTSSNSTKAESEAEQSFLKAIDIARERGAKALELRAATGLSRMLIKNGRQEEALRLLQPVHDWFTEGFNWPELQAAKSILDEYQMQLLFTPLIPFLRLPADAASIVAQRSTIKALVIGASGHLGNAIVRALLDRNYRITACGRRSVPAVNLSNLPVHYYRETPIHLVSLING